MLFMGQPEHDDINARLLAVKFRQNDGELTRRGPTNTTSNCAL